MHTNISTGGELIPMASQPGVFWREKDFYKLVREAP